MGGRRRSPRHLARAGEGSDRGCAHILRHSSPPSPPLAPGAIGRARGRPWRCRSGTFPSISAMSPFLPSPLTSPPSSPPLHMLTRHTSGRLGANSTLRANPSPSLLPSQPCLWFFQGLSTPTVSHFSCFGSSSSPALAITITFSLGRQTPRPSTQIRSPHLWAP